ncbi:hypothetical protein FQR65_LT03174 [Abscondita terminalis]|nr:hypothetical protein FQR65_LT03174 [Abscondita terminalis]
MSGFKVSIMIALFAILGVAMARPGFFGHGHYGHYHGHYGHGHYGHYHHYPVKVIHVIAHPHYHHGGWGWW